MSKEIKLDSPTPKKKSYERWEKSVRIGDLTKRVCVKEAENGFIVEMEVYGDVKKNGRTEWMSETTSYISKTNPLENSKEDEFDKLAKSLKEMEGLKEGSDLFNE